MSIEAGSGEAPFLFYSKPKYPIARQTGGVVDSEI